LLSLLSWQWHWRGTSLKTHSIMNSGGSKDHLAKSGPANESNVVESFRAKGELVPVLIFDKTPMATVSG
jgi:hypothetical protein